MKNVSIFPPDLGEAHMRTDLTQLWTHVGFTSDSHGTNLDFGPYLAWYKLSTPHLTLTIHKLGEFRTHLHILSNYLSNLDFIGPIWNLMGSNFELITQLHFGSILESIGISRILLGTCFGQILSTRVVPQVKLYSRSVHKTAHRWRHSHSPSP